jgi:CheY-like chemotaxis protein/two-component sensor histidine kinase
VAESDTGGNDQAISSRASLLFQSDVPAHESSKVDVESRRQSDRDLAGVLHEVSNALTVVLGWIDRARVELDGESSVEDALSIAAARARHARQIVRRAIGADVPDDAPCAAAALLRDAITGCEPEAAKAGVQLHMSIDPTVEDVQLMGGSIVLQILTNLMLNAIAVSPGQGTVFLDVTGDATGLLVFGVTDEGPGVPVERRANLLDAGVTTRAGGAGIGLRYAAGLARELGGSLHLVRAEPGARFELRWPRRPALVQTSPRSNRKPSVGLAGRHILVVEDDDAVYDLLDATLGTRGAELTRARSRAELEAVLAANRFDAVLCDLSPIRDDVTGALGSIREAGAHSRIIIISGSPNAIAGLPTDWSVSYIRKPFEIQEVVTAITK